MCSVSFHLGTQTPGMPSNGMTARLEENSNINGKKFSKISKEVGPWEQSLFFGPRPLLKSLVTCFCARKCVFPQKKKSTCASHTSVSFRKSSTEAESQPPSARSQSPAGASPGVLRQRTVLGGSK